MQPGMLTVEKKGKKDVFLGRVRPELRAGVSMPGRDGQQVIPVVATSPLTIFSPRRSGWL